VERRGGPKEKERAGRTQDEGSSLTHQNPPPASPAIVLAPSERKINQVLAAPRNWPAWLMNNGLFTGYT